MCGIDSESRALSIGEVSASEASSSETYSREKSTTRKNNYFQKYQKKHGVNSRWQTRRLARGQMQWARSRRPPEVAHPIERATQGRGLAAARPRAHLLRDHRLDKWPVIRAQPNEKKVLKNGKLGCARRFFLRRSSYENASRTTKLSVFRFIFGASGVRRWPEFSAASGGQPRTFASHPTGTGAWPIPFFARVQRPKARTSLPKPFCSSGLVWDVLSATAKINEVLKNWESCLICLPHWLVAQPCCPFATSFHK